MVTIEALALTLPLNIFIVWFESKRARQLGSDGLMADATNTSGAAYGVYGESAVGRGVFGSTDSGYGLYGLASSAGGFGVLGYSSANTGLSTTFKIAGGVAGKKVSWTVTIMLLILITSTAVAQSAGSDDLSWSTIDNGCGL